MNFNRPLYHRLMAPQILLPAFALVLLAAIWLTAWKLIMVAEENSVHVAAASSTELADTYEAQVVRNLREINHTLKIVRYAYEREETAQALADLKARALLPPDLLFQISLADRQGNVVASNRPITVRNIADQAFFSVHRMSDDLWVGRATNSLDSSQYSLQFSRRLNQRDGSFAGVVVVSVDPTYFVSGYDPQKLGYRGVLGIVGRDGVFRVRRSGDTIEMNEITDYATLVGNEGENRVRLMTNPWDGERRYTSVRELYEFSLAVVVGLSEQEQLAATGHRIAGYRWWAAGLSVVLLIFMAVLGRMSWQIARKDLRIRHLAFHDPLTGLPNRILLLDRLQQHLTLAQREQLPVGVMFVDLDRFKAVNDSYGHDIGDALLQELAMRLTGSLRQSDTVARIGGDEYVVVLPDVREPHTYAGIAQKIIETLSRPVFVAGHELQIGVSIGIACFPEDSTDAAVLIKYADTAMYAAKAAGRGTFRFFQQRMTESAVRKLELEVALRNALNNDEFELYYQPKISFADKQIDGVEALLRWNRPNYGVVPPNEFIPLAEETGLIYELGNWVLESACRQARDWEQRGIQGLRIAVNISAKQLQRGDLTARIILLTQQYGISPARLEIELTESVVMTDPEQVATVFARLREIGVTVAIDDFGTGYSSLAYLHRLPIDVLKIDRAFVMKLGEHKEDEEIIKVIVALGSALKLAVVAEGVETEIQEDILRLIGSTSGQGYLYCRPKPAHEIEPMLLGLRRLG